MPERRKAVAATETAASCPVVGLTGGIASGKSTVAELFAAKGIAVVDADVVAHRLTAPGGAAIAAIRSAFGAAAIGADGAMDRAAMRQRVFTDAAERRRLESILHPMIRAACENELAAARSPYAMLVVPLLAESPHWQTRCARILVVDCPESIQLDRLMARSGLGREEASRIIAAQASRAQRLAIASDVIVNEGAPDELAYKIDTIHLTYLRILTNPVLKG